MIKGAIFDLDGTLIDSMIIWSHTGERYLAARGIKVEKGLSETLYTMTIDGGAVYMKDKYNLTETVAEIVTGICDMVEDFYANQVEIKKGADKLLADMKADGVKITMATSNTRELIMPALKRLDIAKYFDRIFTCPEENTTKSEPGIFITAAAFMNTLPSDTWVFEDSYYSMEAAKRCGFRVAGIYDEESRQNQNMIKSKADLYYTVIPEYKTLKKMTDILK